MENQQRETQSNGKQRKATKIIKAHQGSIVINRMEEKASETRREQRTATESNLEERKALETTESRIKQQTATESIRKQ